MSLSSLFIEITLVAWNRPWREYYAKEIDKGYQSELFRMVFWGAGRWHDGSQSGTASRCRCPRVLHKSCAGRPMRRRCLHLTPLSIMADVEIYDVESALGQMIEAFQATYNLGHPGLRTSQSTTALCAN